MRYAQRPAGRRIAPTVRSMPPRPPQGGAGDSDAEPVFEWQIEHWTEWLKNEHISGRGFQDVKKIGAKSTMTVYAPTEADAYAKVDAAFTLASGHTRMHRVVSVNEVHP